MNPEVAVHFTNAAATAPAPAVGGRADDAVGASRLDTSPVIVLGGEANALSVIRSLGRLGARVYALGEAGSAVASSRFCNWVPITLDGGVEASWARWLLGPDSGFLKGAVVLACSDAGIRVIADHRPVLLERYCLDLSDPHAQIQMLDKVTTYQHAVAAGVATPGFWTVESRDQLNALRDQLVFPLIVKPRISHVFEEKFGRKYLFASEFEQVTAAVDAADAAGVEVLLMEWIPGPDSRLCSYFTYLDEQGRAQFHFTKRIIRRYPTGMGAACYHVTDWIPRLIEPSLKLFSQVGLRGLANVEYKQDPRDGKFKLIECNARFVGSNGLVASSGFDLAAFVYNRLTGRPQPPLEKYRQGLRLWDPARDWDAFNELRAQGEMNFFQWIASVAHRQTFSWFQWSDPKPAIARALKPLRKKWKGPRPR